MKSHSRRLGAHFSSRSALEPRDTQELESTWNVIARRRIDEARTRTRIRTGAALALAAAVLFLVARFGVWPWVAPVPVEAHQTAPLRSLALSDGTPLPEMLTDTVTAGGSGRTISLDDGSRLELAAGAKLVTRPSAPARVELALAQGLVNFDVKPGGPRAWRIDAGHTVVRVLGTRFSVLRIGARVEVAVERGRVQVESDLMPGHARTLGPGESVRVDERAAEPAAVATGMPPTTTGTTTDTTTTSGPLAPPVAALPRATAAPSAPPAPPVDESSAKSTMERADEARRNARPREAADLLAPVARSRDPRASLAAFTLGKVMSLDLHDDKAGAMWFEHAHVLGLPAALDEEAIARAAECHARTGAIGDARRLRALYRERFPNGRKLADTETWSRD